MRPAERDLVAELVARITGPTETQEAIPKEIVDDLTIGATPDAKIISLQLLFPVTQLVSTGVYRGAVEQPRVMLATREAGWARALDAIIVLQTERAANARWTTIVLQYAMMPDHIPIREMKAVAMDEQHVLYSYYVSYSSAF